MDSGYLLGNPVALVIFLFTVFTSLFTLYQEQDLFRKFILHPWSVVRERRYYTLVTSGLLHGDVGHLIFNMLTFYFFAFALESFIGHWQFGVLYVASLVLSSVSTVIKKRNDPDYYCLGASGAVSAVIFSFILHAPRSAIYIMFIPIGIPAPIFAILYLVYSHYASKRPGGHINHEAHFWGALSGLLLTLLLHPAAYAGFVGVLRVGF